MAFIFRLKAYNDGSIKEVINNAPLTTQYVSTGMGKFNKPCISFPGQRYQKIYTPGNILYSLNEFQISCWVKWSSPISTRTCCYPLSIEPTLSRAGGTWSSDANPVFQITQAYRSAGWCEALLGTDATYNAGSSNIASSALASQIDTWVYQTTTLKNNMLKFYINGKIFGNTVNVLQSDWDAFRLNKNLYTRFGGQSWSSEAQDYCGIFLLDDFIVSDKVINDGEFTPPSGYLVDSYNTYKDKDSYLYGYK